MIIEPPNVVIEEYDIQRGKLLTREGDVDQLWRVVVAADKLARSVAWWDCDA